MAELRSLEILQKRVEALIDGIPRLPEGDAETIHHTRVATRRLREVLPVVVADNGRAKDLRRGLRDVNRILGPIRELDVLSQLIAELKPERQYSLAAVG